MTRLPWPSSLLERNQETRVTTSTLRPFGGGAWSPDGQRVAFRAAGAGVDAIYVKSVSGGTDEILRQVQARLPHRTGRATAAGSSTQTTMRRPVRTSWGRTQAAR